eukprot:3909741-Pleurochrysis_carterae.AAC.4
MAVDVWHRLVLAGLKLNSNAKFTAQNIDQIARALLEALQVFWVGIINPKKVADNEGEHHNDCVQYRREAGREQRKELEEAGLVEIEPAVHTGKVILHDSRLCGILLSQLCNLFAQHLARLIGDQVGATLSVLAARCHTGNQGEAHHSTLPLASSGNALQQSQPLRTYAPQEA